MTLKEVPELAMLQLGRRHLHQAPADSIHEGLDAVISKKRQLLLDFLRRLLTEFHILCRRVLVLGAVMRVCATASEAVTVKGKRRPSKGGHGKVSVGHRRSAHLNVLAAAWLSDVRTCNKG